ncbi:glucosylglycerol-phosphate synthase [Foetidibacter luteolus]|uniref:glucosylglycerol-phosphate synthase n=1 Tax=Foetidibacter luteolus TaxID=2608880 RepID=UPI00129B6575|nr:glucosylglycerol-phosphate synthase [Foetidibacter luteolus]
MILATDLDGTFLGGKSLHKQQLYRLIRKDTSIQLIFVTGRGLESVIPLLNDPIIPNPDYIICDVGATVVNGHTLEAIEPLQNEIEQHWPGVLKIREAVKDIKGLQYQEVPQQRRVSFFVKDENVIEEVKEKVAEIDCDVIYSANKFLDVLPKGTNKGSTLTNLIKFLKSSTDEVLVAGDTLNDMAMYQCGFKGVVVGNSEDKLVQATKDIEHVYHAKHPGAGGILESLKNFQQLAHYSRKFDEEVIQEEKSDTPQLVMMYHRFPYEIKEINGVKERVSPNSPNGILPTLQSFFTSGRSGVWIAWEEVAKSGEQLRNVYIDKDKYPNLMASRIGLTKKEVEIFYKSFAKEAFWPTIFSFIEKAKFNHHHWDHFVNINRLFAQKASEQADYGAIVWIHDYNLWLVPGLLRELRPDVKIGFFHHTAFPAANTFNILPWRREIISSLLQCDYVGFHIPRYVENFVDVVKSLFPVEVLEEINCAPRYLTYSTALGVQKMTTTIKTDHRVVKLGANPVGINVGYIKQLMQQQELQDKITAMKTQMGDKKVILSVERLDYVKGPLEKVLAFEQFLNDYPEFHGKVELLQICTPPAQGMKIYDKIQHDLEHAIGRINGRYSRIDWIPIRLFSRSFPFEELLTYYAAADIAWITPLRDGLNLVAKEYIAVQGQIPSSKGVLILSEFAGAAVELQYALLTNPYDLRSLKECLLQGLLLDDNDKQTRMQRLYEQVEHYDIDFWADDFLNHLGN